MLQQRFFDNFIFFACGFLIKFFSFLYNFQFIFYFSLAFFYYKKILHLFHFFIVSHPHALDFCFFLVFSCLAENPGHGQAPSVTVWVQSAKT